MYSNIELLPTDKALMLRKQQKAQSTLSPHLRVLQFFESHFSAIRLGNLQDQQLAIRLVSSTAAGLSKSKGHPLAREVHFRIVLFGLRILRHLAPRNSGAAWKLKDQILGQAPNENQRRKIRPILDPHPAASADGIARHAGEQRAVYGRNVAKVPTAAARPSLDGRRIETAT